MPSLKTYKAVSVFLAILLVGTLGVAAYYYQAQVNSLNQISQLKGQVSQLQAANLLGDFKWSSGCFFGCSSSISGEIVNAGTVAAYGASVAFTFYSGNNYTGQVVCTTSYVIGDLAGRSMTTMSSISCTSTAQANSMQYSIHWS